MLGISVSDYIFDPVLHIDRFLRDLQIVQRKTRHTLNLILSYFISSNVSWHEKAKSSYESLYRKKFPNKYGSIRISTGRN